MPRLGEVVRAAQLRRYLPAQLVLTEGQCGNAVVVVSGDAEPLAYRRVAEPVIVANPIRAVGGVVKRHKCSPVLSQRGGWCGSGCCRRNGSGRGRRHGRRRGCGRRCYSRLWRRGGGRSSRWSRRRSGTVTAGAQDEGDGQHCKDCEPAGTDGRYSHYRDFPSSRVCIAGSETDGGVSVRLSGLPKSQALVLRSMSIGSLSNRGCVRSLRAPPRHYVQRCCQLSSARLAPHVSRAAPVRRRCSSPDVVPRDVVCRREARVASPMPPYGPR